MKEDATRLARDEKTSDERETSEHRDTYGSRKKRDIIFLILFLLFLLFCGWAAYMRINNPNMTIWSLLRGGLRLPTFAKKSVIKPREPKLLTDKKVTKTISGKDGGSVTLVSDNGYTYEAVLPPGLRNGDVTISLTPLEEAPFEYPSEGSGQVPSDPNAPPDPNNPPADEPPDPGVDVGVDPGGPPRPPDTGPPNPVDPVEPNDSGVDIYVFPPGVGGPIRTLQTGGDPNQQAQDILTSLGLGNIASMISPTPEQAKPNRTGTTEPPNVIILIPRDKRVRIRKPSPVWANNGHEKPPEGGGTDVPDGGGTATPDDPDGTKGEDQADQAAANAGGKCSAEFINAVINAYGRAGAEGQKQAEKRYGNLLKECDEEILGYIRRLCQSDKRLLRRSDFVTARDLLVLTKAADEKQQELLALERTCIGSYTLSDNGIQPESSMGVTMAGSITASVCGYFDDLWRGKTTYVLTADGGEHAYEGTTAFRLPPRGGQFAVQDTSGGHTISIGGGGMAMALPNLGFSGNFDSRYTVDVVLYPAIKLNIEIPKSTADCEEPPMDIPAIPLSN